MVEKQEINGREVWIKVDAHPIERENPNIIPREYFSASCYNSEPAEDSRNGDSIKDEDGSVKMFESPVAALSYARKVMEKGVIAEEHTTQQTQQEQKETD